MGVESPTDDDRTGADIETLQDTLGSELITFVDALNGELETYIEDAPDLHRYEYVIGDVSDYSVAGSGHAHFDLIHENATLHCVLYQFRRSSVAANIENGMQLAVTGDLSFYTVEGSVSIIVEDVVDVGEGLYQQTYEQNKQILTDANLLDEAAKQSLPEYPRCIGIVTSASSNARDDAVTSLHERHPGVDIVVSDTTVQGNPAMQAMMQAIDTLDNDPQIDVIVLTRGGGATKHLRVFNETPLCRVIHNTTTPVVVGVGHEADRTLADEVADRRVMTPTDVGAIVPRYDDLDETLATTTERLETAYTQAVTTRLTELERSLDQAYKSLEQQKIHEREQAEAARAQRRQRIALAVLAVLILLLLGYILL